MKAEELMIGDWVTYVNRKDHWAGRIVALRKDGQIQIDITDGSTAINKYFHFKPIPLTSEILEKNGFTKHAYGYSYGVFKLTGNLDDNDAVYFTLYIWGENIKVDYVHQLQHALRLCGIDKEIQL